ncbi:unnamed protein product [Boreogadus saida]
MLGTADFKPGHWVGVKYDDPRKTRRKCRRKRYLWCENKDKEGWRRRRSAASPEAVGNGEVAATARSTPWHDGDQAPSRPTDAAEMSRRRRRPTPNAWSVIKGVLFRCSSTALRVLPSRPLATPERLLWDAPLDTSLKVLLNSLRCSLPVRISISVQLPLQALLGSSPYTSLGSSINLSKGAPPSRPSLALEAALELPVTSRRCSPHCPSAPPGALWGAPLTPSLRVLPLTGPLLPLEAALGAPLNLSKG